MKVFYISIFILIFAIIPFPGAGEEKISKIKPGGEQYLSDVESNEYKKFLDEMRKTDRKRIYIDYKEDRDTKYRKLRESAYFEEREAAILSQRLWDQRHAERWDRQSQLIEKVYSGSDLESERAARALKYGYPKTGRRQSQY